MEYAAYPHRTTKHVPPLPTIWQLDDLRVAAIKGYEDRPVTMTSVVDIANVVKRAVEYRGEWPEVGGISGVQISPRQIQKVVENIRGK